MEREYLLIGNDVKMFMICAIPVILVLIQAFLFLKLAWKGSDGLISDETKKKVVVNSAIFSVVPSLPIVISIAILIPILGQYVPWLRLSVIGSVMYESAAADMALKSFGLAEGLNHVGITPAHFIGVIWIMSAGMLSGPILNVFVLKSYSKKLKEATKKGGFKSIAVGSLFTGIILFLGVPKALNLEAPLSMVSFFIAGITVLLCESISKKTKIALINEFSFPISMLCGMFAAIVCSPIIG